MPVAPRSLTVAVLLCIAATLFPRCDASLTAGASADTCSYLPNMNISALDVSPPIFTASSFDCCQLCYRKKDFCRVAVFVNYMCHFKAAPGPMVPPTAGQLSTVVSMGAPTPPPAPTPIPPTPAPPVTPAPQTPTPQTPSPPTPAPSVAPLPPTGKVTLYRHESCESSPSCDPVQDTTCTTKIYYSNVCYGTEKHVCEATDIRKYRYNPPYDNCTGDANQEVWSKNICAPTQKQNGQMLYRGHYCDVLDPPQPYLTLTMWSCGQNQCGSGVSCSSSNFTTGICQEPGSVIMNCFPDGGYITVATYPQDKCQGAPTIMALPLGKCYQDVSNQYYENTCN